MKRKMIGAAAAYMTGLFFASFFNGIGTLLILAAASVIFLAAGRYSGYRKNDYIIISLFFCSAVLISTVYTHVLYRPVAAYDGKTGSFEGVVTDIRRYDGEHASYVLKGHIDGDKAAKVSYYSADADVGYGDTIRLSGCEFSAPEGDYAYNSRGDLRSRHIFLRVDRAETAEVIHRDSRSIRAGIMGYRERMISEFRIALGADAGDFLAGMVFGEKQGMDEDVKTSLYRCGIGHVLAVSGLHVSVVALALIWLLRKLRVNKYASFVMVTMLLAVITVMADSPVSAIRAAIMVEIMYSARLFRRQNDTFNSLAAAVLLICLADPYVIYSSGFLMSVAGTFGIGVFGTYMAELIPDKGYLTSFLSKLTGAFCAMLCIMPLSMKYFDETSLISPVTNVIIVPFCSVCMITGVVYVFTGGSIDLLGFAGAVIQMIFNISDKLARISATYFTASSERVVAFSFFCAAAVILVQAVFRSRLYTGAAASLSCSLIFLFSALNGRMLYDTFTVAVLGSGNNAAVVVSFKGNTDVIDISGSYRSPMYVKKYLSRNNIGNIRDLVLMEDIQSQYSAYKGELEFIAADEWLVSGETEVLGGGPVSCYGSEGMISCEGYDIFFSDDRLVISYGDTDITFEKPSDVTGEENGLVVCYGRKSGDPERAENVIYLGNKEAEDMNNFEIMPESGGGYRLRRL